MPVVRLDGRAVLDVNGPDAEHLLQNIVTTDIAALPAGVAAPGALLTPQGKVLFDFLLSRAADDGFAIECRADIADDFARRLAMYKLRAKAEIRKREQTVVTVTWQAESAPSSEDSSASHTTSGQVQADSAPSADGSTALRDARFAERLAVRRSYAIDADASADISEWTRLRIDNGVAESGSDYALGDSFPHDVLLDQNGGVGFRKGCFVGQEVVSRMQHRGTARRRILVAEGDADLPPAGTPVLAEGRPAGALGTVLGRHGLALVRIDKVKAAMDAGVPVTAGDVALQLSIPPGMRFTFPETVAGEEA